MRHVAPWPGRAGVDISWTYVRCHWQGARLRYRPAESEESSQGCEIFPWHRVDRYGHVTFVRSASHDLPYLVSHLFDFLKRSDCAHPRPTHLLSRCRSVRLRLGEERKQWRKDHPFGFWAKPVRQANGVIDLKVWDVGIPGREKTIWEGGLFKLNLTFPDEYPTKPPKCGFRNLASRW